MGFTYKTVTRAAYHLAPHSAPWTIEYRALQFPEQARESLLGLCNYGRHQGDDLYRTVPTYRLDGVLQSLAPDLVVCARPKDTAVSEKDFWLYSPAGLPDPLPGPTMNRLLSAWLRTLGPASAVGTPGYRDLWAKTLTELDASPLLWQDDTVDLLGCPLTTGGTAAPAARQFQLATDALARRIMALEPYDFGTGVLRFRAIPRGARQKGAELMSQPHSHQIKGRTWWFSITINITLHTVPLDPTPRLHIHTGVRRWATHPRTDTGRVYLPYRRATTVYLRPTIPWLPGAPASERYAVAKLAYDQRRSAVDWAENGPAGILRNLALRQAFPDPEALLRAPEAWLGDGPGVRAAIVHSNHMGAHEIGPGLMSHQRSQIIEWAEQALPAELVRAQPLARSTAGTSKPANARAAVEGAAKKTEEERAAYERRSALGAAARINAGDHHSPMDGPAVVEFRLLWQTSTVREAAITALSDILGLDGDGEALLPELGQRHGTCTDYDGAAPGNAVVRQWHTPELTVVLRCIPLSGGLADKLHINKRNCSGTTALGDAINTRRHELVRYLTDDGARSATPTLALVEIAHRSTFVPANTDPKFAVRLGCADAGVLTQFVAVPSNAKGIKNAKNVDHRVRSSWLDGLRQLGVRVLPEHTLHGDLPENLRYAAVWMVKRRKDGPTRLPLHMPVAVRVTPMPHGNGRAQIEGWDDDAKEWIPYPRFLLGLVRKAEISNIDREPGTAADVESTAADPSTEPAKKRITRAAWRKNMEQQRQEAASFLQRMIYSLRSQPTILITHSQNSRQHWPWLQDSKVVMDLIKTGHAPASGLHHNLRLVRIRGSAGRETPQWWGVAGEPDGINGLPAGLWTQSGRSGTEQRIFYSTTEKASQFKASAVSADRLAPRELTRGKNAGNLTIDADKPAWNPSLVEIAILGCHRAGDSDDHSDKPEAIALAVHQLRQAPDYLDALSLPLPLHLAGLAQEYVLPTITDDDPAAEDDRVEYIETADDGSRDLDPDLADAPGLEQEPEPYEQILLFV
ncbi:pPIWI_RE module domain-containing protein [Nocardia stercoris]|uniref:DUF3893 domain-containing protein n=1 Tax=Nocardia stercoris TaxID=2483361 RepID=A0A3M2L6S9_9NOCA|nr:DUF3962 domain-containing protein [Nocardia stercoris]RMI32696.1 DUF3893 domain-containing protein [Nocardia stercoris]